MPPPRDPKDGYTLDEAVIAQMYEHEALLKLLIEKGVIAKYRTLLVFEQEHLHHRTQFQTA